MGMGGGAGGRHKFIAMEQGKTAVIGGGSGRIEAAASVVYGIIADYTGPHQRIIPPRYLRRLEAERGGVGAGTIIRFELVMMGSARKMRAEVTEPRPGRELRENDVTGRGFTSFQVEPIDDRSCNVRIETHSIAQGIRLWLERRLAGPLLNRIIVEELKLLADEAARIRARD